MKKIIFVILFFMGLGASATQAQNKGFRGIIAQHNFVDRAGESKPLSEILDGYKGKVVYVDFWASWCAPCLKEMPHSKALHQYLAENKDIVFLYISIDDTDEVWKSAIGKQQIGETGDHIRRSREDIEPMMRQLYIYTIPHYWIIDKEGIPRELDATSPSDKRLGKILSKLAAE